MRLVGDGEAAYRLTAEQEADRIGADAEMKRGRFATHAEVEAVFSEYRL